MSQLLYLVATPPMLRSGHVGRPKFDIHVPREQMIMSALVESGFTGPQRAGSTEYNSRANGSIWFVCKCIRYTVRWRFRP